MALTENKLCNIQLNFGADSIPAGCRSFPRLNNSGVFRGYKTATLSCPEIVNKIFLNANGTLFRVQESEIDVSSIDEEELHYSALLRKFDNIIIKTLESHNFPIGNSLKFLADTFTRIIEQSDSIDSMDQFVEDLQENYQQALKELKQAVNKGLVTVDALNSGWFWYEMYKLCKARNIQERFLADYSSDFVAANKKIDGSPESFYNLYQVIRLKKKRFRKQYKNKFDKLFRIYLRMQFANSGFPVAPRAIKFDISYVNCIINICIFQLLIWIEMKKDKKITVQFIKDCIVEVDRRFSHSKATMEFLKKNSQMLQV